MEYEKINTSGKGFPNPVQGKAWYIKIMDSNTVFKR